MTAAAQMVKVSLNVIGTDLLFLCHIYASYDPSYVMWDNKSHKITPQNQGKVKRKRLREKREKRERS